MGKKTRILVKKIMPIFLGIFMLSSILVVLPTAPSTQKTMTLEIDFGKNSQGQEQIFTKQVLVNDKPVFEILAGFYSVTPQETSDGLRIKSIGGLSEGDGMVWRVYANGKLITSQVESYTPENGDVITFRYEHEDFNATKTVY